MSPRRESLFHRICCVPHRRVTLVRRSSSDSHPSRVTEERQQRRKNRPGYNSYLKVLLDNTTIDRLHECAITIQKRISDLQKEEGDPSMELKAATETISTESPLPVLPTSSEPEREEMADVHELAIPKPTRFKPRSKSSLHMTLLFAGESLCEVPRAELVDWHCRISSRLSQSGFQLASTESSSGTSKNRDQTFSFQVKKLAVFPPRRNNLVVAILEPCVAKDDASTSWQQLYDDIQTISQDERCSKGIANICKLSRKKWTAHVTLGNLYHVKKRNLTGLNVMLDGIFQEASKNYRNSGIHERNPAASLDGSWTALTRGIGLGGPIPKQVDLEWNFVLSNPKVN
ncbi:hypothetical protein IV203_007083 [Nitzschia inconspicua]|uniref:Uncharacterized protein n=1 Tax=Nitzschia inconspicua TaxID=303405 RepID=A0A9K3KEN0_9STRA|nr:hypothetical protein IV203_007083 [Nitzschia inconspicua]